MIDLIVYPVRDLARAKTFYRALLGVDPYSDAPYYVGYRVGGQEIGLDPNGHAQGLTGPLGYRRVNDIASALRQLADAGAQTVQDVRDVGGGKLVAWIKDTDGNLIGLMQEPR